MKWSHDPTTRPASIINARQHMLISCYFCHIFQSVSYSLVGMYFPYPKDISGCSDYPIYIWKVMF